MALQPIRSEQSGVFNYDESNQAFAITWSPSGAETGPGTINSATWTLNTRFLVTEYRLEIIANFMGVAWLAYGDSDDASNLTNWVPSNEELYSALVQKKTISGEESRTVMRYKARWSKKHKKWTRPPLRFGTRNSGGNYATWSFANTQVGSVNDAYYSLFSCKIHRLD